jgi:hypothetical protein
MLWLRASKTPYFDSFPVKVNVNFTLEQATKGKRGR